MVDFRGVLNALKNFTDNFDRQTFHQITDLLDVPGEHDFTPERLRYYKDGTRRFLEYGSDSNYSETNTGHLLEPDADQTLTLKSAERVAYPVGLDLIASMASRLTQAPDTGDVVGGGYGEIDLADFDPSQVDTGADNPASGVYSGTTADGYFWYHTEDTGLNQAILAMVQEGTVVYSTIVNLSVNADTLTIKEGELNWYAVGPAKWTQSYTDIANEPEDPQQNDFIGAVANDDGKGPKDGSQRINMAIYQAAGNSGLGLEAGSIGVRASGVPNYQFKSKGHKMVLANTNTDADTYQVLGAIQTDPDRPTIKARISELEITSTPGAEVTETEVLLIAVDSSETNAPAGGSWDTPVEHNPSNSVIEMVEVDGDATTPLTGPDQAASGTDVSGPVTTETMTNPGGYQMGRETVEVEGTGSKTSVASAQQIGNRSIFDTDIALVLVKSATAGDVTIDVETTQN